MTEIWALAFKDLKLLAREKVAFFFTFVFPIAYASLFGLMFGGSGSTNKPGIAVAVVDEDGSTKSTRFLALLDEGPELDLTAKPLDDAIDAVRRGDSVAYLRLPKGFGDGLGAFGGPNRAALDVGIDPSRSAEGGMLEGLLQATSFRSLQDVFGDPLATKAMTEKTLRELEASDMPLAQRLVFRKFFGALEEFVQRTPDTEERGPSGGASTAFQPVTINKVGISRRRRGPVNAFEVSFPQSILWAIMGATSGFAISLVVERQRGTLLRLQTSPLTKRHILLGKGLACFLTNLIVTSFLLLLGALAFGVRVASFPKLALAILAVSLGFVGIMSLLSTLGRSEQGAGGLGWAILMPMAMIGGGMVPLFVMPGFLQKISVISPIRWGIQLLEGAVWRDFSWAEMAPGAGILLAVGVVGFALGSRIFRWE